MREPPEHSRRPSRPSEVDNRPEEPVSNEEARKWMERERERRSLRKQKGK